MPQYTTFDQFARDLLVNSTLFPVTLNVRYSDLTPFMEEALYCLDFFEESYYNLFQLVFMKNEYQDLRNDEQFLKFFIPRCLKLIDNERYFFSMMLIASFLQTIVDNLIQTRYCYRFCFTAYKCLTAVFKRALEDSFESNGGWKGFKKFCKEVDKALKKGDSLSIGDLNEIDKSPNERMAKLIMECDNVSDCFLLNSYELSLLKNEDVEEVLQSLDNDVSDEDPLDLKWPPSKEEMQEKLRSAWEPFPCDDYNIYCDDGDSDDWDDYEERFDTLIPSYLRSYVVQLHSEAKRRFDYHVLKEKMELRKCPCCGIQCFQFSCKLYAKQLDLVLSQQTPKWRKSLKRFISRLSWRL